MLDEKEVYKKLSLIFNFIFFGAIISVVAIYYFSREALLTEDLIIFQTAVILMLLICIPGGLKLYAVKVKALQNIADKEEKLNQYVSWNIVRLALIEAPLFFSLVVYFLTKNNSMLFCAGIAIMALIFCKPSLQRMKEELGI